MSEKKDGGKVVNDIHQARSVEEQVESDLHSVSSPAGQTSISHGIKQDGSNVTDYPAKCSDPFSIILHYAFRKTTEKNTSENVLLDELKESVEELSCSEMADLFKTLTEYIIKVNEGNKNTNEGELEMSCIESLLTSNIFRRKYIESARALYPYVLTLNNYFDFSGTPFFFKEPGPAVYGGRFKKRGRNGDIYKPLRKDEILKIIDAGVSTGHQYIAGEWIFTVLSFSVSKLYMINESVDKKVEAYCKDTVYEVKKATMENREYQDALLKYLLSESNDESIYNYIEKLTKISIAKDNAESTTAKMKKELSEANRKFESCQAENGRLLDQCSSLNLLRAEHEKLNGEYKKSNERLDSQIYINETLAADGFRSKQNTNEQIERLHTEIRNLREEVTDRQLIIESLKRERVNIEADLENERKKLLMLKSDIDTNIKKATDDFAGEFVCAIKDQINHFSKAFNYFRKDGIDLDTLEICFDDLRGLIDALKPLNVIAIGETDKEELFDVSVHHCEQSIQPGDKVRIVNIGWMVSGKVISKAEVEIVEG